MLNVINENERWLHRFKNHLKLPLAAGDDQKYKRQVNEIFSIYFDSYRFTNYYDVINIHNEMDGFFDEEIIKFWILIIMKKRLS